MRSREMDELRSGEMGLALAGRLPASGMSTELETGSTLESLSYRDFQVSKDLVTTRNDGMLPARDSANE